MPSPSQSVVIPAFNEELRIEQTVRESLTWLGQQRWQSELLVVDDGSTDQTPEILSRLAGECPSLQVVSIDHSGKASAVRRGLAESTGDLIAFADADMATPIQYIERFRKVAAGGADVVIGSREGKGATRIGEPASRHVMGRVFNAIVRLLLLPGIQDTQCGFKLFTREARDRILAGTVLYSSADHRSQGARVTAFDVELLVAATRQGFRIESVPVTWTFGERSKVNPVVDTLVNVRDVLEVKWNDMQGRYS